MRLVEQTSYEEFGVQLDRNLHLLFAIDQDITRDILSVGCAVKVERVVAIHLTAHAGQVFFGHPYGCVIQQTLSKLLIKDVVTAKHRAWH